MNDSNNKRGQFLKDREFPKPEDLQSYKNFDQVLKSHRLAKSIFVKKIIIWSCISLVVTTAAVITYVSQKNTDQLLANETIKQEQIITPPLPGKENQFIAYMINAATGGEIVYNNTIINIPANAFFNEEGKIISDSIKFVYREFLNPLDIFLSGIPMQYDSGGISFTFESAGMFEMQAYKGDKKLILDANKPIKVELPFTAKENYFNYYTLDDKTGKWNYVNKNTVQERMKIKIADDPVNLSNTPRDFTSTVASILSPQKADQEKFNFTIKYDEKNFPELATYENVLFEVTDNKKFDKTFYKINWDAISLRSTDTKGIFTAKLDKADTSIYVDVKPVFNEKNYDAALKTFEKTQEKISKKTTVKQIENENRLNKVNNTIGANSASLKSKAEKDYVNTLAKYSVIYARSLGTHNCDFPTPPPPTISQISVANNFKGFNTTTNSIYVIEQGKNALFKYTGEECVKYNRDKKNLVWTMNDKKEFLLLDQDELDKPDPSITSNASRLVKEEEALKRITEFMN